MNMNQRFRTNGDLAAQIRSRFLSAQFIAVLIQRAWVTDFGMDARVGGAAFVIERSGTDPNL